MRAAERQLKELKDRLLPFLEKVNNPRTRGLWTYPKAKLSGDWSLSDLAGAVQAADKAGYDTMLIYTEEGIEVYLKQQAGSFYL